MSDTHAPESASASDAFTADEAAYFDSRGESGPSDQPASAQAGESAPAADPVTPPEGQPTDAPAKHVPLAALHEERTKRQEMQRELEATKQRIADMEARFRQVQEPPQAPAVPDPQTDPFGYMQHMDARIKAFEQAQQQAAEQQTQQARQQEFQQRFVQTVGAAVTEFAATTPDYQDAVQYIYQRRASDLAVMGYSVEEQREIVAREEMSIAARALQLGLNPAKVAYDLAKGWGFQGGANPSAPAAPDRAANGTFQAKTAGAASVSLSGRGGSTPSGLTLEAVANMSDADFAKLSDADFRRIAGG